MHATVTTQLYITSILVMMTWTSFGGLLWGTSSNGTLFTIDVTTAEYNKVAQFNEPSKPTELVYDCINDKMYVAQGDENYIFPLVDMNMDDGSVISNTTVSGPYPGLEFVDGTLYGWLRSSSTGYGWRILDPITGMATFIHPNTIFDNGRTTGRPPFGGMAFNVETNTMYAVTSGCDYSELATIDLNTGQILTAVGTGILPFSSLAIDDNQVLYGGTGCVESDKEGKIYRIDPSNGETELLVDLSAILGDENAISGLAWVPDEGCITKQPTANPTLAPTQPTKSPTNQSKEGNGSSDDDSN